MSYAAWRSKVREEGCCRICGFVRDGRIPDPPKTGYVNGHHLVPVAERGTANADNIVPLCFRCHKVIDSGKPTNAAERDRLRRLLRAKLTESEIGYCDRRMGRGWTDGNYPPEIPRKSPGVSPALAPAARGAAPGDYFFEWLRLYGPTPPVAGGPNNE